MPVNSDRPTEPLTDDDVQAIHHAAMHVLEDIGIEFLNAAAVEILRKADCIVDGENVRMGQDLVMEQLRHAPSSFTLTPRNPERRIEIGGHRMVFGSVSSPPNCSDIDRGRRPGREKATATSSS